MVSRFPRVVSYFLYVSLPPISTVSFSTPYSSEIKENRITREGNPSTVQIVVGRAVRAELHVKDWLIFHFSDWKY